MLKPINATKEFTVKEKIALENAKTVSIANEVKSGNDIAVTNVTDIYVAEATNPKTNEPFMYAGLISESGYTAIISGSMAVKTIDEIIEAVKSNELSHEELKQFTFKGEYKLSANSGNTFFNLIVE